MRSKPCANLVAGLLILVFSCSPVLLTSQLVAVAVSTQPNVRGVAVDNSTVSHASENSGEQPSEARSPARILESANSEQAGQWSDGFAQPGTNGVIRAFAEDHAGNLYIGGAFTMAGGVAANNVAKWDGNTWSALGSGVGAEVGSSVLAIVVDGDGNVYAGGRFATAGGGAANNIAVWNGSAWAALGSGTDDQVSALAADGAGNIYAGGWFTTAGDVAASRVARWHNDTWSALGGGVGGSPAQVDAMAVDSSGNLYVGGLFTNAGNVGAVNIAKWNGTVWSTLGGGTSGQVRAVVVDGVGNVYAGGDFAVVKWDGSSLATLGTGISSSIYALALDSSGKLYAGGYFTIYEWDGNSWSALSGIVGGSTPAVTALLVNSVGQLYAGGYFISVGKVAANHIAKWDGASWSSIGTGQGMNNSIFDLAVDGAGNLYAGGRFTTAGGAVANYIARWDGNSWSALDKITGGDFAAVYAIAADNARNLYAGGSFGKAGTVEFANNIAMWNGDTWSALGGGTSSVVHALAIDGDGNLYAGGEFTVADNRPASNIAKWDGSAWSALGSGVNDIVHALAGDNAGNIYVGGSFGSAGGIVAPGIAKWDGSSWSALGTGISGGGAYVKALAVDSAGILYAGGWFTAAGDVSAQNIARWDGKTWSALGSGVNESVGALAIDGAGNVFAAAGIGISMWDGSSWSMLDGVMDDSINALAIDEADSIYAGGWFTSIGTMPSARIGRWEPVHDGISLTIERAGTGMGKVTSTPAGINCGSACKAYFTLGQTVTLTAAPDPAMLFTGWSGACTGTDTCLVTMDSAKIVTATFALQTFPLTVSKSGLGTGKITSSPAGIDCGATCSAPFAAGQSLTLSATPDPGMLFTGWSGACTDTDTCVVTMDSAKTVTATFAVQTFPLTVSKSGLGTGKVTSNPAGIDCGATCSAPFAAGQSLTLSATPDPGMLFTGWSGVCTGMGSCVVTMDSAKTVTATFAVQTFPLTVSKTGIGTGIVTSSPAGIDCGITCSASFVAGQSVTLSASPDAGMLFSGWSGACSGGSGCVVSVNAARAVTASFSIAGAVAAQDNTMYYGQQLEVMNSGVVASSFGETRLVVINGAAPAGMMLVGVEGSAPYTGEADVGRLLNRLLATGCDTGTACSAVLCSIYEPDGSHVDMTVSAAVITDYLHLPVISRP